MKVEVSGGFLSLLGLLFIALKLIGLIDWSWWWVLCPLWFPTAVALVTVVIIFGGAFLMTARDKLWK